MTRPPSFHAILTCVAVVAGFTPRASAETAADSPYSGKFRPQFHFSAKKGYINDPNGLFYHDGVYHMFFQHWDMGKKAWGHATSPDLLHWIEHGDALKPMDGFQAFSGSAVVDVHNTSGFKNGEHPPIVALFTAWGDGQHLAYSNDGGWTWKRHGKVLELPADDKASFPMTARDPMVIWHEPTRKWVMIIYQNFAQTKDGKAFGFYTSPDLKDWTYASKLPGYYVCPDLFELPLESEPGVSKWVILDWERDNCKYAIGMFDGREFTTESGPLKFVHGKRNHAATQTWKQAPPGDERLIQIANIWRGKFPGEPFENQMSVPLELKLRRTPDGIRLCRTPIAEVASLYRDSKTAPAFQLASGKTKSIPRKTRSFALEAELAIPKEGELTIGVLGQPITLKPGAVTFGGFTGELPGTTVKKLKILADVTSVEVFVNDGEVVMIHLVEPPAEALPVTLKAGGSGELSFQSLEVHRVASIWPHTKAGAAPQKPFEAVPVANLQIPIPITGNYLNLPVDDSQSRRYLVLKDPSGEAVTDFHISLAAGKQVFWGSVDVRSHKGKTLTLTVDRITRNHGALETIHQSDEIPDLATIYDLDFRPRFHYSPRVGWVNDPNGLVHYNGTWHLFYQWNPYGMRWSNMHWGYATSTDLVHWTDHGAGITPRFRKAAYSGSGTVDWNNTSGLQTGKHPPILLYYTENGELYQQRNMRRTPQRLVYSTDGGKTWKEYEKNPILPPMARPDGSYHGDRDPIVRWYEPGKHWSMMLFVGGNTFRIFRSENGLDWTHASDFKAPGHNECPDLFEIALEGNPADSKWVFVSGSGSFSRGDCAKYIVGTFDGETFTPLQESIPIDRGRDNYSTQTFSDAPGGRRIFVSWLTRNFHSTGLEGMPANAQFRVPWELSLYQTANGYRLRRLPVKEIEQVRGRSHQWKDLPLTADGPFDAELTTADLDVELRIAPGATASFTLHLSGFEASYDADASEFRAFGRKVPLDPIDGLLSLRILADRSSVEIFANDGTTVLSGFVPLDLGKPPFRITADGGSPRIESLAIHEMKSIWKR